MENEAVPTPEAEVLLSDNPEVQTIDSPAPDGDGPGEAAPIPVPVEPVNVGKHVAALDDALKTLRASSNATTSGTIVHDAIKKFHAAIEGLKSELKKL